MLPHASVCFFRDRAPFREFKGSCRISDWTVFSQIDSKAKFFNKNLVELFGDTLNLGENCSIWFSATCLKLSEWAGHDHGRRRRPGNQS